MCGVQGLGLRVWNSGFVILSLGSGFRDLGLRCEVGSLGFGV